MEPVLGEAVNTDEIFWLGIAAAWLVVAALWVAIVRSRKQRAKWRAEREQEEHELEAREREELLQQAHEREQQGRRALYRREMAARELDRYYGRFAWDEDPTFEEWLISHGYANGTERESDEAADQQRP